MKAIKQLTKLYCGIDVSGDTLDICYQTAEGVLEWCKCSNGVLAAAFVVHEIT